jgi:hypothetical protein
LALAVIPPSQRPRKCVRTWSLQHGATWKEGDGKWAYHPDAAANIETHKVSLDPYRLELGRIVALIKEHLPSHPPQRVERARIDEVFADLSAHVHAILLERFPELADPLDKIGVARLCDFSNSTTPIFLSPLQLYLKHKTSQPRGPRPASGKHSHQRPESAI